MKFENTEVFNFDGAIRGMRNPMNSWDKSDSLYCIESCTMDVELCQKYYEGLCDGHRHNNLHIGKNDLELMQKLIKAGSEHRKFMRQVFVSVDITAPLYWWKEFDTYKVGTVSNSCSTMHKLAETPITIDCFEMGDFNKENDILVDNGLYAWLPTDYWNDVVRHLEDLRCKHNEMKIFLNELKEKKTSENTINNTYKLVKRYWKELIRLLPESWLQKRTITMNYENLLNICSKGQRRFHKLTEWSVDFINWARSLPYAQELIFLDELEESK